MAIKIIKHKQTPKELAYHFKCGCGCEFWSDSEGVLAVRSLNVILFYQTSGSPAFFAPDGRHGIPHGVNSMVVAVGVTADNIAVPVSLIFVM